VNSEVHRRKGGKVLACSKTADLVGKRRGSDVIDISAFERYLGNGR
jgi:hypothetical protein